MATLEAMRSHHNFRPRAAELYSSTRTILDILQSEFPVLPMQDDRVSIPPHEMVRGGEFVISDVNKGNAGGEVTLRLKRLAPSKFVGAAR